MQVVSNLSKIAHLYDTIIFDIWGVIHEGGLPYPGVASYINNLAKQTNVYFLSNTPRPSNITVNNLASYGIHTIRDFVITSGEVVRNNIITGATKGMIYHLGADKNQDILKELDRLTVSTLSDADYILLTYYALDDEDNQIIFEIFQEAKGLNLPLLCANPDISVPNKNLRTNCSGYFAKYYSDIGGEVSYCGKPYPEVFAKVPAIGKVLMVGDTIETDIIGANNFGFDSALVLTGNSRGLDYSKLEVQPTYVMHSTS